MASRKGSSQSDLDKELQSKREKQLEEIISIVERVEICLEKARGMRAQYALLSSVSLGLYDEVDKLTKKAPSEPVTDLVLSQVNDVIREVKELAQDDPYVQRLNEFVAAGDNPEQRDVVIVLRQLRQGLERFGDTISPRIKKLANMLNEATTVQVALQLFKEGKMAISPENVDEFGFAHSEIWFTGKDMFDQHFDWNRLDRINFNSYFPPC
jgi:hypothetical protein